MLDGQRAWPSPATRSGCRGASRTGCSKPLGPDVKCVFWVSPARRLYDLFWALHNLGPQANPADVVAISAKHEVDFLPPPDAE